MEIVEKTVVLRTIEAGEGKYLTQIEAKDYERVYAKVITLSKYDAPENWKEVDEAEKLAHDEKVKQAYEAKKNNNEVKE